LKKGKYALYTIQIFKVGKLFLYDRQLGYTKEFNEANVALRTVVKRGSTKAIETFTIGINGLDTNFAYLEIYWENSRVALKFEVPTQKKRQWQA
jgi:hypothetical protein